MQVDGAGALPAFANRPYDQTLAPPHVSAGKNTFFAGAIIHDIGRHVAACIEFHFRLIDKSHFAWADKAHCEEDQVGFQRELGSGDFLHLAVDPFDAHAFQPLDIAVGADHPLGQDRPVALAAFQMAG